MRDVDRIVKYAGERCCVCGKYGADDTREHDVSILRAHVTFHRLTLKGPATNDIHPKCYKQLLGLIERKMKACPSANTSRTN